VYLIFNTCVNDAYSYYLKSAYLINFGKSI